MLPNHWINLVLLAGLSDVEEAEWVWDGSQCQTRDFEGHKNLTMVHSCEEKV